MQTPTPKLLAARRNRFHEIFCYAKPRLALERLIGQPPDGSEPRDSPEEYMMQSKRFIVLMTARSGSTWLVTLLNGQPGVAAYEELMLPYHPEPEYTWIAADAPPRFFTRRNSLPGPRPRKLWRYLAEVENHRSGAEASGFKINAAQLPRLPEMLPLLALRRYRLLVLVRENVFESSVSQMLTRLGGPIHGKEPGEPRAVVLDPAKLHRLMRSRLRWLTALRALRAAWPWPSTVLSYEALVADQAGALGSILHTIGIDRPPAAVESPLKRRVTQPYPELITNFDEVSSVLRAAGLGCYLPKATAG